MRNSESRSSFNFISMFLLARCFYYCRICSFAASEASTCVPKIIISRLFIIKARGLERCYYEFSIRFESFIDSLKLIFLHYSLYNLVLSEQVSAFHFLRNIQYTTCRTSLSTQLREEGTHRSKIITS